MLFLKNTSNKMPEFTGGIKPGLDFIKILKKENY
jgi:hypothetical protein